MFNSNTAENFKREAEYRIERTEEWLSRYPRCFANYETMSKEALEREFKYHQDCHEELKTMHQQLPVYQMLFEGSDGVKKLVLMTEEIRRYIKLINDAYDDLEEVVRLFESQIEEEDRLKALDAYSEQAPDLLLKLSSFEQ